MPDNPPEDDNNPETEEAADNIEVTEEAADYIEVLVDEEAGEEFKGWKWQSQHPAWVKAMNEIDKALGKDICHGKVHKEARGVCGCSKSIGWTSMNLDPVDPLIKNTNDPKKTSTESDPGKWCDRRLVFWVPELFYNRHIKHMPCPNCGPVNGTVIRKGWLPPRLVCSFTKDYFMICKKYMCSQCNREFNGFNQAALDHLPQMVRDRFPAKVFPKVAIEKPLIDLLVTRISSGQSITSFRSELKELK